MTGTPGPTGARRATRVSRTAARQAKRERAKRRQQLIGAGVVVALLLGGATYAIVAGSRDGGRAGSAAEGGRTDSNLLGDADFLLDTEGAKKISTGTWTVANTAEGSETPERSFSCQSQRFADPAGVRTWVRSFKNAAAKSSAVEYIELSNDSGGAQRAYSAIVGWLSTCAQPRQRLVASYNAAGLGDRGIVAVFAEPLTGLQQRYRVLTVAGTGPATMVFEYVLAGTKTPATSGTVGAASEALKKLCAQTRTACPRTLELKPALIRTTNDTAPGFLIPIDLPVMKTLGPWEGVPAPSNNQTDCSEMTQPGIKPKRAKNQAYVVPDSKAPLEFGLDTKVLEFATPQQANAFVTAVRTKLDECKGSNLKTKRVLSVNQSGGITGQTWLFTAELPNGKDLNYRVGIARAGQRVTYALFLVLKDLDISDRAFADVVARAGQRSLYFK
jgi:hypothetical protein